MAEAFVFFEDLSDLCGEGICLRLRGTSPGDPARSYVPVYMFDIADAETGQTLGRLDLRVGMNRNIDYGGNIGYEVLPEFRGHRYAAKACRLAFRLARRHGMERVRITCVPENAASRRTCELAGAVLTEIATLPEDTEMYATGRRRSCLYDVKLV